MNLEVPVVKHLLEVAPTGLQRVPLGGQIDGEYSTVEFADGLASSESSFRTASEL